MERVTELGYLGIGVRDIDAWKAFAAEVLGLEVVPGDGPGSCSLRMDYWFQRFVVTQNGTDDLDFVGWRVASADAFEEVRQRLQKAEVRHEVASSLQAEDRHVLGLMTLEDPAGVPTEIFYGPRVEPSLPFRPGRRMHGSFVSRERGLGHVVTSTSSPAQCEDFYSRILGMRGSLELEMQLLLGGTESRMRMHFMSCNSRQHSIAFGNFGGQRRLIHVMTEVTMLEDVGLTRDIVRQRGVPIRLDIGQHHNDRAVSFYFETPSGWLWECGWGVAPPTGQAEWGTAAIWGHEFVPAKTLTPVSS